MKHIMLVWLSIKSAYKYIPKMLAGTIICLIIVILIAVCRIHMEAATDADVKMQLAVVVDEDVSLTEQRYVEQIFRYVQSIDSVKNVCSIDMNQSEKEAEYRLKKGELTAIIRIPDGFVEGILDGRNIPATVIFAEGNFTVSSMLLRYMMQAGAIDLSTAQAGIYAVDDLVIKYSDSQNALDNMANAENQLNRKYFLYALDRGVYFDAKTVSDTGELSVTQFYICSAVVLFLMLSGMSCGGLMKSNNKAFAGSAFRQGIIPGEIQLYRILGAGLVHFMVLGVAYVLLALSTIRYIVMSTYIEVHSAGQALLSVAAIFILILSVMALVNLVYNIAANETAGALLIFILSVIMIYASGGIVSEALLPDAVALMGTWLPTKYYLKLCGQIVTGSVCSFTILLVVVYTVVFVIIGVIAERMRNRYL